MDQAIGLNPKSEIRNPKEIRSPNTESEGRRGISPALFANPFRISGSMRTPKLRRGIAINSLIGNGLGRRRWGCFARSGCRRGAHGVTRPTALGSRQGLLISLPASDFGLNEPAGDAAAGFVRSTGSAVPRTGWSAGRPGACANSNPAVFPRWRWRHGSGYPRSRSR